MKLEKGVPFTSQNLAAALQDDEGTFLCQIGGQNYIVEAQHGHSITNGPTPVGPRVPLVPQSYSGNPESWTITKLDSRAINFRQSSGSGETSGEFRSVRSQQAS